MIVFLFFCVCPKSRFVRILPSSPLPRYDRPRIQMGLNEIFSPSSFPPCFSFAARVASSSGRNEEEDFEDGNRRRSDSASKLELGQKLQRLAMVESLICSRLVGPTGQADTPLEEEEEGLFLSPPRRCLNLSLTSPRE